MEIKTNYASNQIAKDYYCNTCKIKGVKLWREYQTFMNHQVLYCVDCALKNQNVPDGKVREDGKYLCETIKEIKDISTGEMIKNWEVWTDQIKWLVPAVPLENEDTFWGYSSVPQDGVDWWKKLPLRK